MSISPNDTAPSYRIDGKSKRVGFVALLPSSSAIHSKLRGQRRALEELVREGVIESCVTVVVSRDTRNRDTFAFGSSQVTFSGGRWWSGKVNWLCGYSHFLRMIWKETLRLGLDTLYVRKLPIFDRRLIWTLNSLRRKGVRILFEIPTYPYDGELKEPLITAMDKDARRHLFSAADRIIIVSGKEDEVFGVRTICVSNGVDFESVGPAKAGKVTSAIDLVSVSSLESWHRIDRVVSATRRYWEEGGNGIKSLVIVGEGPYRKELEHLSRGETRIRFMGPLFGNQLDDVFTDHTIGIGDLEEVETRGIETVQPLKHREYTARGVPFIYGPTDPDFEGSPYALRVPDGPINLEAVLAWWNALDEGVEEIRGDAKRFSWVEQMRKILERASDE